MNAIEFTDVTKMYGNRTILNHINFEIKEGVLTGIIGRNGVGKTTLMKITAGHITETSGSVDVFSETTFNSL